MMIEDNYILCIYLLLFSIDFYDKQDEKIGMFDCAHSFLAAADYDATLGLLIVSRLFRVSVSVFFKAGF